MARYPLRGVIRDGNGKVVSSATVTVYESDTTTGATIYAAKTGGSAISSSQVSSDTNGNWICYVDSDDYPIVSLFDVVVSKSGYVSQTYEDVTL